MRAENLKGWLEETSKKEREEAVAEQATAAEGPMEVPEGRGLGEVVRGGGLVCV